MDLIDQVAGRRLWNRSVFVRSAIVQALELAVGQETVDRVLNHASASNLLKTHPVPNSINPVLGKYDRPR